ncbi:MAG: hypothetical protein KDA92_04780 [Planctomycetales bacterium]|nr:hypothetical protein [Planctomycetales bacterium]MCA9166453.1 hypothetical protein [Planctomycetales bacterium]
MVLTACEVLSAGDANLDCYFDAADWVQVMQRDLLNSGQAAEWADGDWNGDRLFKSSDVVSAFASTKYQTGYFGEPPDDGTVPAPQHVLFTIPADVAVSAADMTIYYSSATGDLLAVSPVPLTTVWLKSVNNLFVPAATSARFDDPSIFDLSSANELFALSTSGVNKLAFHHALPQGWTLDEVRTELRFNGSRSGAGDLGVVRLAEMSEYQLDPEQVSSESFVSLSDANALFYYDFETGDVTIQAIGEGFTVLELRSKLEQFVGTQTNDYRQSLFDLSRRDRIFMLVLTGEQRRELPGLLPPGLTRAELLADLSHSGSTTDSSPFHLALVYVESSSPSIKGRIYLDANGNGTLDQDDGEVPDIGVELLNEQGHVLASAITGNETLGEFTFARVAAGTYQLHVTPPAGYQVVPDQQVTISPMAGTLEINVGLYRKTVFAPLPGDANRDGYFDEADLIAIMQIGHFNRPVMATWESGDFDGDGVATWTDLILAYQTPYRDYEHIDSNTNAPLHSRRPLVADDDSDADVRVIYLRETGSFAIIARQELTALHLHSDAGWLAGTPSELMYEVQSAHDNFWFRPSGLNATQGFLVSGLPNLTADRLLADLTIDGARAAAGELGRVSLTVVSSHPSVVSCMEIRLSGAVAGDANLDGVFDTQDLIDVFQRGKYRDVPINNSTWYDGDWNCDGEFDTADLVEAFTQGGFEFEENAAAAISAIKRLARLNSEASE